MSARFTTTCQRGYLPRGSTVELVHLSGTVREPGRAARDPHQGDGLWWRVKFPNGIVARHVRAGTELEQLGIYRADLVPARRERTS